MTFKTNVVPQSDHTATKHLSVRYSLRAGITASAMLALFHLLLQNLVWTTMLIPANAASENQKVVRFVDKIYTKIDRLCQFFVGKNCLPCFEERTKLIDLITVLTFFSSEVDLSNILILFVLILSAIQHSNKNLALTMKVTACSTDNFDGCKKESGCKEVFAFRRFVVDGILKTCFLSLNENKPWLIVHLDDYRPVSYVRVAASPKFPLDRLIVSVGMKILQVTDKSNSKFILC